MQKNVELVTESITAVHAHALETQDGKIRDFDTLIFGTGFKVTNFQIAHVIFGRGGKNLFATWQSSPRAFLGTTVNGFPNLFLLMGPNTGLGHNSVLLMMEAQVRYIVQGLQWLQKDPQRLCEPRPERESSYTESVDTLSARTVWKAGRCQSWYLDATGRNSTLWPSSVPAFQRRLKAFDPDDYMQHSV